MLRQLKLNAVKHCLYSVFCTMMVLAVTMSITSCDSDEPDNGGDDNTSTGIVTESELVGTWTLVMDNVLYSEVNSQKTDETITYSGNSSPSYKFYKVTVSDENILSVTEVSVSGSKIEDSVEYTLKGNDLIIAQSDNVAGTIENYNPDHSWNNLRIKWNTDYAPIKYGAPVISTYML